MGPEARAPRGCTLAWDVFLLISGCIVWRKAKVMVIGKMTQSYCFSPATVDKMCARACLCVRMRACMRVCAFVRVCMCLHVRVCVPLYMDSHSLSEKPPLSQALPIGGFSCSMLLNDEREPLSPFCLGVCV